MLIAVALGSDQYSAFIAFHKSFTESRNAPLFRLFFIDLVNKFRGKLFSLGRFAMKLKCIHVEYNVMILTQAEARDQLDWRAQTPD
jgi:hypothetical protein